MAEIVPLRNGKSSSPATLLRAARRRSGMTIEQYASALGTSLGRPSLSPATLRVWETGSVTPPFDVVQAAVEMQDRLPPAVDNGSVSELVHASVSDARALLSGTRSELDSSIATGQAYAQAADLAVRYLTSPPAPLLAEAAQRRADILATLRDHLPPGEAADLYLVAGLLSGISAYAALDLGHPDAAMTEAEAGLLCAQFAGHDGLRAWMYGTQSLIARFQTRYSLALDLARQGLEWAHDGTALDRLRCGEAQSLACLGDAPGARYALQLANEARDHINGSDAAGGLFTFSEAKHSYYSGSSLIWLPQMEAAAVAEEESQRAIELFTTGPADERNLADEALAHVYLGTARVTLGEVEGVLDAIRPVLDIPPKRRISWQHKRLRRLSSMLDEDRFARSKAVHAVQEEIAAFSGDAHPPTLS